MCGEGRGWTLWARWLPLLPKNSQAPREPHTLLFCVQVWKLDWLVVVGIREDVGWAGGEKSPGTQPSNYKLKTETF